MIFISDIIVNFIDGDRLYEFFEWQKDDLYEHIKKIPLFRVDTEILKDFTHNKVKSSKDFLEEIKYKTEIFKATGIKKIKYAVLLTDTKRVVAFEFNESGILIARSSLLLDEEDEILEISSNIDEVVINYERKVNNTSTINTRKEEFIKNFLLQDIKYSYLNEDYSKIRYLYNEIYPSTNKSIKSIYNELITGIKNNFSVKHEKIFNILKLSNIK